MAKRKGPKTLEDVETQKAVKAALNSYNVAIIGDDARRSQECMQKIQEVLAKYECVLVPRCMLSPQGAEFMIEAMPAPKKQSTDAGKKLTGYADGQQRVVSTPLQGAPNAADKKG